MIALPLTGSAELPLANDEASWTKALELTARLLDDVSQGRCELPASALSIAASAARSGDASAPALVAKLRRVLVRSSDDAERSLRCLRALARAGEAVDRDRLAAALSLDGRLPRIALAALAELAGREDAEALALVAGELAGPLRADAALLLANLCSDPALDALAPELRTPGPAGIHASAALLSAEDDPFAFGVLCERLCEPADQVLAARSLWGALAHGAALMNAEASLGRWHARGIEAAESGRIVAAALLTARGRSQDVAASWRAIASEDDELAVIGAEAAYALGDAQRAHAATAGLVRRTPSVAAKAFGLLVSWADDGDRRALSFVRPLVKSRPVELGRQALFEALASTRTPELFDEVRRALTGRDRLEALDAARALARLREPPALTPPTWL